MIYSIRMQKTSVKRFLVLACLFFVVLTSYGQEGTYNFVFENGKEGYNCYRIPAVIKAPNGDLLAFAEARKKDCDDFGDIDIVMKRSRNNGATWQPLEIVVDNNVYKAGDPAPVVDRFDPKFRKGRIFLHYNTATGSETSVRTGQNVRESLYITSEDNGKTWTVPVNITTQVHKPYAPDFNPAYTFKEDWRTIANTPGHAMQFTKGKYKGRIYVAANHSVGPKSDKDDFSNYRSHGFFSDDHGKTWQLTPDINIPGGNESIAAELSDGSLLQNARYQNKQVKSRILAKSSTGGQSWDTAYISKELPEPICQGSMLSVQYKKKYYILFSNPKNQNSRKDMTITASDDDGSSWKYSLLVDDGNSAYSDLVQLNKKDIGIIYERGNKGGIVFKTYSMTQILQ
jgi:sialidase-1